MELTDNWDQLLIYLKLSIQFCVALYVYRHQLSVNGINCFIFFNKTLEHEKHLSKMHSLMPSTLIHIEFKNG